MVFTLIECLNKIIKLRFSVVGNVEDFKPVIDLKKNILVK